LRVNIISRDQEKKRKRDDIHNHRLLEIAAREASSKRVKETAATHNANQREDVRSVNPACPDYDGNVPRHKFGTVPERPHKFGKSE
jgi:hypothetical protein